MPSEMYFGFKEDIFTLKNHFNFIFSFYLFILKSKENYQFFFPPISPFISEGTHSSYCWKQ